MTPTPVRCCHCGGPIQTKPRRTPDGRQAHESCEIQVRERGYRPEHRTRLALTTQQTRRDAD